MNLSAPPDQLVETDVTRALEEDTGSGDATADLIDAHTRAHAILTCREDAVLAGTPWFDACFRLLDPAVAIQWSAHDGDRITAGSNVCTLYGNARALVGAERSALNFLQLLSATATLTARYVEAVRGSRARVLDTRKTVPGLRLAQKYAVRCGGGENQRLGLYDAVLIKENHITAAGGLTAAVRTARWLHPALPLEVEVESLDELREALGSGADRIMLDNFDLARMRKAVAIAAGRVPLEVSGNVGLDTIAEIAATGVDFISVGALTKHVQAVDFSLRLHLAP